MYVLATVSQEAFIAAWIALGDDYDAERDRLVEEQQVLMATKPKSLDPAWLQRKRGATVALRNALAHRTVLQGSALCELLASSQDTEARFQEWHLELPWSDWAQDALERATRVRRVLDERARGNAVAAQQAHAPGAPRSTSAWSHAPAAGNNSALSQYMTLGSLCFGTQSCD